MKWIKLVLYTMVWCLCFPLFALLSKNASKKLRLYPDRLPRQIRKFWKLAKRGRMLSAWELFWSTWNPIITEKTTRPLFELCGGNRRPFFATMAVFLYSGIFLHVIYLLCMHTYVVYLLKTIKVIGGSYAYLSRPLLFAMVVVVFFHICTGFLVACAKWFRARRLKEIRQKKIPKTQLISSHETVGI